MLAVAVGAGLGVLVMVALAVASFAGTSTTKPVALPGAQRLAPGAREWQPIPSPGDAPVSHLWIGKNGKLLVSSTTVPHGSQWDTLANAWTKSDELAPQRPMHPTVADLSWRLLPDGTWLTIKEGSAAPILEPSKAMLPVVPRCKPATLHYRLSTATRTGDGSLLVGVWHEDDQTSRVWKLPPGAAAWQDTGAVPVTTVAATLVAGGDKTALLVSGDSQIALWDGATWRALPLLPVDRMGWQAALAPDGSVIAAATLPNTPKTTRTAHRVILALFVVACLVAWRVLDLGPLPLAFGIGLGVGGAVVAFFVIWIFIGARF